ncbi:MAG: N-acetylglucosamine-6-phosphate deacetylase [Clostridia bacterium]|nr:N-acetylglucosamine-6-phosphate deacetylase [Clostridia bacterium]
MIFKNATVLGPDFQFRRTDFETENGKVVRMGDIPGPGEDLSGRYVVPGLLDLHTHGAAGYDYLDGTPEALRTICSYMRSVGTTSVFATVMTQEPARMRQAVEQAARMAKEGAQDCAHIRGIYLEGPFFSYRYRGAQHPDYLQKPDEEAFAYLTGPAGDLPLAVALAPELEGAPELVAAHPGLYFTAAHTDADYEQGKTALEAGVRGLTHTFNAMRGLDHHNPGLISAFLEDDRVFCECICDGIHVHPSLIRMLYRAIGRERFMVISDSLAPTGLPAGTAQSGGQRITIRDGCAYLDSGKIAGSITHSLQEVRNLIRWGICTPEDAFYAATAVPARAVGLGDAIGKLAPGFSADFLVLDPDYKLLRVYLGQ